MHAFFDVAVVKSRWPACLLFLVLLVSRTHGKQSLGLGPYARYECEKLQSLLTHPHLIPAELG